MTLQELRDEFIFRYKLECSKRNVKEINFPDRVIAKFISNAEAQLQQDVGLIQSNYTIPLVADTADYDLPDDFGELIAVKYGNDYMERVSNKDFVTTTSIKFNIYTAGAGFRIRFTKAPDTSKTIIVYYYVDVRKYQPSGDANYQNWDSLTQTWETLYAPYDSEPPLWGSFNGIQWSGNIAFPDKYSEALIYHMLSNIFDDYLGKYEFEISKYVWRNANKRSFAYRINGGIG